MESIRIILGQNEIFDKLVHDGLPQAGAVTIATKDDGTTSHKPVVVIAFPVQLPDGSTRVVQAVVTVRMLVGFYSLMRGRYGPEGPEGHRMTGEESPFIH